MIAESPNKYLGPAPDLGRASDVWFLQYYRHGQKFYDFPSPAKISSIPAPRYLSIQTIVRPEVKELFEELFKRRGLRSTEAETFETENDEGKMLLGTKHGNAVAKFLIQHKDFFGDLLINNVRVLHKGRWSLCFEIGEVDGQEDSGGVAKRWEMLFRAKL